MAAAARQMRHAMCHMAQHTKATQALPTSTLFGPAHSHSFIRPAVTLACAVGMHDFITLNRCPTFYSKIDRPTVRVCHGEQFTWQMPTLLSFHCCCVDILGDRVGDCD